MKRDPAKPRGECPHCSRRCYVWQPHPPDGKPKVWRCRAHGYQPERGGKTVPCPGAGEVCAGDIFGDRGVSE